MRICFKYKDAPKTGKGKFAQRLGAELEWLGVNIVQDERQTVDVDLQFGKWNYQPHEGAKTIIRLGPAHVDTTQDYRALNAAKWKSVKKADGIVYQSQYSRKVCRRFIGRPAAEEQIIFNGADPHDSERPYDSPYEVNFLASTRKWIPNKRLSDIQKAWISAALPNACLWVCGDLQGQKKVTGTSSGIIRYLGLVDSLTLSALYQRCRTLIHVVYLDAAPNSVVEALCAGCSVIHTDQGGTHELVGNRGVCILDRPYDFKPINLTKPPKVDRETLCEAIHLEAVQPHWEDCPHLHISEIARQYLSFMEKICAKK